MPCNLSFTFAGRNFVCDNPGTTAHAGPHTANMDIFGSTVTWRWFGPATGRTLKNTCSSPAMHKPQVVGQAD